MGLAGRGLLTGVMTMIAGAECHWLEHVCRQVQSGNPRRGLLFVVDCILWTTEIEQKKILNIKPGKYIDGYRCMRRIYMRYGFYLRAAPQG